MGRFYGYNHFMSKSEYEAYDRLSKDEQYAYRRQHGDCAPRSTSFKSSTWDTVIELMGGKNAPRVIDASYMYSLGMLFKLLSELQEWRTCYNSKGEQGTLILSSYFGRDTGVGLLFKPDNEKYAVELFGHEVRAEWYGMSDVLRHLPDGLEYMQNQRHFKKGPLPVESPVEAKLLDLTKKYEVLLEMYSDLATKLTALGSEPVKSEPVKSESVKSEPVKSDWVMCNLSAIRKSQGKTQKQMADDFGITRSTYQHYERDFRLPSELYAKL